MAGLLACDLYLFLVRNCCRHTSDKGIPYFGKNEKKTLKCYHVPGSILHLIRINTRLDIRESSL